jgi:hypothetical protein
VLPTCLQSADIGISGSASTVCLSMQGWGLGPLLSPTWRFCSLDQLRSISCWDRWRGYMQRPVAFEVRSCS